MQKSPVISRRKAERKSDLHTRLDKPFHIAKICWWNLLVWWVLPMKSQLNRRETITYNVFLNVLHETNQFRWWKWSCQVKTNDLTLFWLIANENRHLFPRCYRGKRYQNGNLNENPSFLAESCSKQTPKCKKYFSNMSGLGGVAVRKCVTQGFE